MILSSKVATKPTAEKESPQIDSALTTAIMDLFKEGFSVDYIGEIVAKILNEENKRIEEERKKKAAEEERQKKKNEEIRAQRKSKEADAIAELLNEFVKEYYPRIADDGISGSQLIEFIEALEKWAGMFESWDSIFSF